MVANPGFETAGALDQNASAWFVRARSRGSLALMHGQDDLTPIAAPNDFTAGSWLATAATLTANTDTDPDGGAAADLLEDTVANSLHIVEEVAQSLALGDRAAFVVHVQDQGRGFAVVGWGLGTANYGYAIVDLTLGSTVLSARGGTVSAVDACVTEVGAGWMLVELVIKAGAAIASIRPGVGASDGAAVSYVGAGLGIALWGAAVTVPTSFSDADGLEVGWPTDGYLFALVVPTSEIPTSFETSFVDPLGFENFESAWNNYPFLTILSSEQTASFDEDVTPDATEDFDAGWLTSPYYSTLSGIETAVSFDEDGTPEALEDFEEGWLLYAYATTVVGGTDVVWDGPGAEAAEDFEEAFPDILATPSNVFDLFVATGHSYTVSTPGYFYVPSGFIAQPLYPNVLYWPVTVVAGVSFEVSETSGGATVDILTNGIGPHYFRPDPARFWNGEHFNTTI